MKKKFLSIIVILALVVNLMPITYVRAASVAKITIGADKTEAKPGETVNYTVSAESDTPFLSMTLTLDIPSGLSFVDGSAEFNSALASAARNKPEDAIYFQEHEEDDDGNLIDVKQIGMGLSKAYTLNGKTEVATFQCKVDDNATGDLTVRFSFHTMGDKNYADIAHDVSYATVSVDTSVPATGVTLNKKSLTLEQGKKDTITATVAPEDATDKAITWTSSDTSVATVENGTITAVSKGTATITALTSNGKTATCTVTVTQPITGITLDKTTLELNKDDVAKITATVVPENADGDKTVTWTSSDEKVATVNNGTVTAVGKGSAIITASTPNGKEATCNVTVGVALKSISLNETEKSIKNGDSFTFEVTYNPEDTDAEKAVTWTSSDTSVATVDENGKVTVIKCSGTTTITATAKADNSITATATVVAAHKDEKLTLHAAKAATCIAEGNTDYYTCSGCEDYFKDDTGRVKIEDKTSVVLPIDADAHDWSDWTVTKEATCTEEGSKTRTCKLDRNHTPQTEVIEKIKHELTRTDAVEATCEKDGNIEYYTCSACGKYFKDDTASVEITEADTIVKALGHDWGNWVETTPATTEAEGVETRTCNRDSSHIETRAVPKIHKHELVKTEAKAATCVAEGNIEYWTCSVCKKTFSDSEGTQEIDNVTIAINPEAHDWNDWVVEKEATCTEEGLQTRTCKLDSNHKQTEAIEKIAHKLTKTEAKAATCEEDGNIEYYTCSACGKYFKDDTARTEITKADTVIKATGHDWDDGTITTPKTCTTDGVKTYTCKNDSNHTRTETIPASHELTKHEAKAATCVAEGNIEYWECSECGKKFSDAEGKKEFTDITKPIDPNAHDWDEWVIEKEATVDETGSKTRTCKLDKSHTETAEIARLPYEILDGNNQTHTYEGGEDLVIRANGTFDKFVDLQIDGVTLKLGTDYTVESGSTIATIKSSYLNTLSEGNHTATFVYTDGTVSAGFRVAQAETNEGTTDNASSTDSTNNETTTSSSPKTGDNIIVWISLMIGSVIGAAGIAKLIRRKD